MNRKSNHPPLIKNDIPAAINRRLSNIFSNQRVFEDAIPPYQVAIDKSGYEFKRKFEQVSGNNKRKKTRNKRDVAPTLLSKCGNQCGG